MDRKQAQERLILDCAQRRGYNSDLVRTIALYPELLREKVVLPDWGKDDYPLHLACRFYNFDEFKILLEAFPEGAGLLSSTGELPLHIVCIRGCSNYDDYNTIDLLLKANPAAASIPNPITGDLPLISILRSQDCDKLDGHLLTRLVEAYPEALSANVDAVTGNLALHTACQYRLELPLVSRIQQGFPKAALIPNRNGDMPLHIECRNGLGEPIAKILLDGEECSKAACHRNKNGMLPLHLACRGASTCEALQLLLEVYPEGVQLVESQSKGELPLHLISDNENIRVKSVMLILEANPRAASMRCSIDKNLPLHCLCQNNTLWGYPDFRQNTMDVLQKEPRPTKLLQEFLAVYPQAASSANAAGDLPLHVLCRLQSENVEPILYMARYFPDALTHKNADGDLPVHVFFRALGQNQLGEHMRHLAGVLDLVARELHPPKTTPAAMMANNNGDWPIHVACRSGSFGICPQVLLEQEHVALTIESRDRLIPALLAAATATTSSTNNEAGNLMKTTDSINEIYILLRVSPPSFIFNNRCQSHGERNDRNFNRNKY